MDVQKTIAVTMQPKLTPKGARDIHFGQLVFYIDAAASLVGLGIWAQTQLSEDQAYGVVCLRPDSATFKPGEFTLFEIDQYELVPDIASAVFGTPSAGDLIARPNGFCMYVTGLVNERGRAQQGLLDLRNGSLAAVTEAPKSACLAWCLVDAHGRILLKRTASSLRHGAGS